MYVPSVTSVMQDDVGEYRTAEKSFFGFCERDREHQKAFDAIVPLSAIAQGALRLTETNSDI